MWFDTGFWMSGEFMASLKEVPFIGGIVSYFDDDEEVYTGQQLYDETMKPRRIVVNGGSAREVYNKKADFYDEAITYIDAVIADMKGTDVTVDQLTYEELKNLFKT